MTDAVAVDSAAYKGNRALWVRPRNRELKGNDPKTRAQRFAPTDLFSAVPIANLWSAC